MSLLAKNKTPRRIAAFVFAFAFDLENLYEDFPGRLFKRIQPSGEYHLFLFYCLLAPLT
jgi:hypothetical protein